MSNTYQNGDEVRFRGRFYNADGELQDPTNVYFIIKAPSGTITRYTYGVDAAMKKEATGIYYIDLGLDESGYWPHRWYSTGTGKAADESDVYVEESEFEAYL